MRPETPPRRPQTWYGWNSCCGPRVASNTTGARGTWPSRSTRSGPGWRCASSPDRDRADDRQGRATMTERTSHPQSGGTDRRGFILPAGLLVLIVMAIVMLGAWRLSDDERRSSRAVRETGAALYNAESGVAATVGAWPAGANALNSGDSLSLGWTTLSNGAQYRAVIHRVDNGATKTFALMVDARGVGALGGRSSVMRMLTTSSTGGGGFVTIGGFGLNTGHTADRHHL